MSGCTDPTSTASHYLPSSPTVTHPLLSACKMTRTDQSGPSRLLVLFEAALDDYEKQTDITLERHPLLESLQHCHTVESVTAFLQNQVRACSGSQGIDRIMESLDGTVSVLSSLSASFDNLGSTFPLVKTISAGLAVLLATVKDVRTLNPIVDLLKSIEHLLIHLDIYTKVPPTAAMTNIVTKTLVELFFMLALATKLIKQGRPEKMARKFSGQMYNEMVLERLDQLTPDDARTIAARILEIVHGLVLNMRAVMEDGKASIVRVKDAQNVMYNILSDAKKSKRGELQQDIQNWLSPPDPSINHKIAYKLRHTGTAAWFLQGETFSEWMLSESSSLLWIHGKPGAGKSVLCSAIIHVIDTTRQAGLASLAYFYCDFRDDKKRGLRGLVSSLLAQLCHQSDSYYDIISKLYRRHTKGSRDPSDNALVLCLKGILKLPGQVPVFLIVDALDECPISLDSHSPRGKVLMLMKQLMDSQFPKLRICVTSRAETDVRVILEPLSLCSICLHDESGQREDIARYIKSVVHMDPGMRKWRATDKQLVVDVLTHKVDGVFLWMFLQFSHLRHCPRNRIQRTLGDLPETLDGIYRRTLRDIDKAGRALAHRLFSIVCVACRPLPAEELVELLAFNFKPEGGPFRLFRRGWRQEDLVNAVQTTYSSLLAIVKDGDTTTVQFSHSSVQEFFKSSILSSASADVSCYHVPMEPTHTLVAQACLDVLLRIDRNVVTRDSLRGYPLAEYAAEHWLDHARFGNVWQNVEDEVKHLFDPRMPHLEVCIWIHDPESPRWMRAKRAERPLTLAGTPLHYAALWDLQSIVQFLVVEHSQNVNAPGFASVVTPLHSAAKMGHLEVARFLLERGANVAIRGDWFTPLHIASREGQLQVVILLLEQGADVTGQVKGWLTPLHLASREGQLEVARLLLEWGADVSAQAEYERRLTPLHLASQEGQRQVVGLLIDHSADVNARTPDGSTPLHLASQEGQLEVARFLIDHKADVNILNRAGLTPLHLALEVGQLQVARLLIDYSSDVDARDANGATLLYLALQRSQLEVAHILIHQFAEVEGRQMDHSLLHLALREGRLDIVRFLIEHNKADVEGWDMDHVTLLHHASREGRLEIARFLIEHKADVEGRDTDHLTLLHLVSREGQLDIVRFLIEHKADVNARDMMVGFTPLHLASREGQLEVVRFLIDQGADMNAQDMYGSTPLHLASRKGQPEVARILLEQGADSCARDNDNCIPLHRASQSGHLEVARALLEHGTDVNSGDISNWTPLHGASQGGHSQVALLLLYCGANVHASDLGGWTSLQLASCIGHPGMVVYLLKHGADANARDNSNWTPLHCASRWGHHLIARVLLGLGANANARDNNNWTPLHYASQRAHQEVVRALLDNHADVNPRGDGNQTPLHVASRAGYLGIVELLVGNRADIHARNEEGRTPFEEASVKGHRNIMQFLLDAPAMAMFL